MHSVSAQKIILLLGFLKYRKTSYKLELILTIKLQQRIAFRGFGLPHAYKNAVKRGAQLKNI